MQLLSIFRLTRISVVWHSAAEAVLLAMSIAPISSYGWVSFECLLREGLSPQQYALDSTLASTYIPGAGQEACPCRHACNCAALVCFTASLAHYQVQCPNKCYGTCFNSHVVLMCC
jgi:hypothetical protein